MIEIVQAKNGDKKKNKHLQFKSKNNQLKMQNKKMTKNHMISLNNKLTLKKEFTLEI